MDRRLPSDAVGERAENDLTQAEPQEQHRNDELDVVSARHSQLVAYRGQRRQHRVDRERDERHQEGNEGNELAETKGGSDGAAHLASRRETGRAGPGPLTGRAG